MMVGIYGQIHENFIKYFFIQYINITFAPSSHNHFNYFYRFKNKNYYIQIL